MAYGEIKVDSITFTANGSDTTVSVSGLVQNPTFSGDITVTGTISGDIVQGGTLVSGATVSGTTANFVTVSGTTVTGGNGNFTAVTTTTANVTSGVFASGTAGAPSVSVGTTDNGIYSPGTDQVALSTNGTKRIEILADGNIAIDGNGVYYDATNDRLAVGTASPVCLIHGQIASATSTLTEILRLTDTAYCDLKIKLDRGTTAANSVCRVNTLSGNLAFETSDTERLRITSTGQIQSVGLGSAASPALSFSSDTNTGLYSPGTDQVAISTNGTGRLFVAANGNVGIGGSPTTATVYVNGTVLSDTITTSGALQVTRSSSTKTLISDTGSYFINDLSAGSFIPTASAVPTNGMYLPSANSVALATNGTGRLSIDSSGNIGIAAIGQEAAYTDYAKAIVFGASAETSLGIVLRTGSTGTSSIAFADNSGSGAGAQDGLIEYSQTTQALNFHTAGNSSPRLVIDSTGRLGVGTSSPSANLHVLSGGGVVRNAVNDGTAAGTAAYTLNSFNGAYDMAQITATQGAAFTNPVFKIRVSDTSKNLQDRLTIDSSGRLGIGTTSPSAKFHVAGATGGGVAGIWDTAAGGARVEYKDNGTRRGYLNWDTNSIFLAADSGNSIKFSTDAGVTQHATIDSSGRLLVGTSTGRGVGTAYQALTQVETTGYVAYSAVNNTNDVGGPALMFGKSRGTAVGSNTLVQNGDNLGDIYFAGADGTDLENLAARITCAVDGIPGVDDMPGRLVFSTTADGASSPTERMRIDSSGRIGIGTTSPASLLHVNGTGSIVEGRIRNDTNTAGQKAALYLTTSAVSTTFNSAGIEAIRNAGSTDELAFIQGGTEKARIDSSGRLLVGTSSATGPATLQVQTPTTLSTTLDSGVSFTNTSTKTYPTTSSFSVYPGFYQNIELGTAQTVNTGGNFTYGSYSNLTKSAGNTQDIDRLYFYGNYQIFTWSDANTCKTYASVSDIFIYNGKDANGRTSSFFEALNMFLRAPDGGTQTITNVRNKNGYVFVQPQATSTINITNSSNFTADLSIYNSSGAGTKTVNITNHTFFGNVPSWGQYGSEGTLNATITNLYGLRLNAPTGSFTVTNNWGIRQEWSSAKNWFAGVSNQFPNITTTASSANAFLDSADSNRLYRSTSSIVYKRNVEDLDHAYADKIHLLRPVWYRSNCDADCQEWSWYGLIAEEVAEIEPRLVHYGYQEDAYELVDVTETVELPPEDPRREYGEETEEVTKQERRLKADAQQVPNGVAYDRLAVLLLDVVQRQEDRIKDLENRLAALEGA